MINTWMTDLWMIGAAAGGLLILLTIVAVIVGGVRAYRQQSSLGWFVTAGVLFALTLVAFAVTAVIGLREGLLGASEPAEVPCEKVAVFVDAAGLPAGMTDARCTYTGFQDSFYLMNGTVGRAEAATWLAQFPGHPKLTTTDCATGATICTGQIAFTPKATGGAEFAGFEATELPDGRLQFTFTALNT